MHLDSPNKPKLKRAGTKKSRTGCRTCRVRRIKCDETSGSCNNCTKTSRTCDYDIQRLPPSRQRGVSSARTCHLQRTPEIIANFRWAITSDERRCYSYFQHFTIPTLSEVFYSPLWRDLILQMSMSEPAVYHAVIALGAVHQDSETYGMPLPGQDLQNEWHRFAIEQCGRSFALLGRRTSSQDPRFRNTVLLCCVLFILAQLMRGQYDEAVQHISNGLRVLNEAYAQDSQGKLIDPTIITAFAHLGTQSLHYGVDDILSLKTVTEQQEPPTGCDEFANFHEAQWTLGFLLTGACRFLVRCEGLTKEEIAIDYVSLQDEQLQLLSRMSSFDDRFEGFLSTAKLTHKEQRAAEIMLLNRRSLSMLVQIALIWDKSLIDLYTPEYEAQMSLTEGIMERYPERPTVMLELGILPPLYNAAMWCRDFNVRIRAVKALRAWPHREGLFDSNWLAFLALQRMKADLSIQHPPEATACLVNESLMEEQGRWQDLDRREFTLDDALSSTKCMRKWYCVQGLQKVTTMSIT
ncbi:Zn(II)2Cys6 transcription factor [Aspergillus stella-maris]|uniref:Zn(II)2Cys6 transcription factor n=1 Tax=Aspergillus stella-maris TaxID=1810926 RepID=UPI003CCD6C24